MLTKLKTKTVYHKKAAEWTPNILARKSGRVSYHTTKLEPNWRVSIDEVPLRVTKLLKKNCVAQSYCLQETTTGPKLHTDKSSPHQHNLFP
jgi:hypothetical protein